MTASETYFRLHGDSVLARGRSSGTAALYLLVAERMMLLAPAGATVLAMLEGNASIAAAAASTGRRVDDVLDFVASLRAVGAGALYDRPYYVEPLRIPDPLAERLATKVGVGLDVLRVYPGPRQRGNGAQPPPRVRPCHGCGRAIGGGGDDCCLAPEIFAKAVRGAGDLGCRSVVFHIADTVPIEDLMLDLLAAAKAVDGVRVEIVTAAGLGDQLLSAAAECDVHITFESTDDETELQRASERLRATGRPFDVLHVADARQSPLRLKDAAKLGAKRVVIDRALSPHGVATDGAADFADDCIVVPNPWMYIAGLQRSCMNGQLALCPDGTLHACAVMGGTEVGDLRREDVADIFADEREKPFWRAGVETRRECPDCEFRLACVVCPAARSVAADRPCQLAEHLRATL
jgi:radical SAM protein with 4Fe4S-binding SPASM domain